LWGLGIAIIITGLHYQDLVPEFYTWPAGAFIGDLIGRLSAAPLIALIVTLIHNASVARAARKASAE
jgi:hypothetical protein